MKSNKGFTLIELMIVVAIIAILAAIAISGYQHYRDERQGGGSGTQSGYSAAGPEAVGPSTLVCTDATGKEVKNIPAIPGQRWYFEGGSYVTTDANGNPVTEATSGLSCSVK